MAEDVDSELIRKLAGLLEETGLGEIEYAKSDWKIRIARPVAAMVATPAAAPASTATAPQSSPETKAAADTPAALKSPMVGTAYLAPDPQSPTFVSVGSSVAEGDSVMIIEAMKVMNAIPAHRSGTVREILVTSGQPVEYGQVVMVIE